MSAESHAQENEPEGEVSPGYANYVLGVLFTVYVFNFMDRQVLSIVLEDVKRDIQLSDTYMGFLGGFAFSLMYTFAGIPIARYADRASRRNVVTVGLLVWTGFTAMTAFVGSFAQLFAARIGVGIGEAAGSPPSHSMISDYFPAHRRATALSVYGMGVYIGIAAAMIFGGYIASNFGWRSVYLTVGLAGIPLALLVRFSVRELPRGYSDRTAGVAAVVAEQPPFVATIKSIVAIRSLMLIIAGTAAQSLAGYGLMLWGAPFMMRVHGMSQVDVGLALGLIFGIAGCGGVLCGGWLADHFGRHDERWYMRLPAIQVVIGIPFLLGFLLAGNATLALACFAPFYFVANMYIGPMFAMTQGLVPPSMRATASAINLFVVNLVGLGLGPFLMGYLNDALAAEFGKESIRYSLLSVGAVGASAVVFFWLASRSLPRDLAAAREAARAG
ncbi:MAG: MFS transporter [Deltaproteobacteria bacterium]|nr:MFS transporter [Deltaproteobacteria bacterium]MBW2386848.1 MFS transporter [Deltaproteobacteria bacterium]MBW2723029.1 MFS transporter [Deltaproteobacteria bacterium]